MTSRLASSLGQSKSLKNGENGEFTIVSRRFSPLRTNRYALPEVTVCGINGRNALDIVLEVEGEVEAGAINIPVLEEF